MNGSSEEASSSVALALLTALAVLSPWAFGSVDPLPRYLLVLVSLWTAGLALAWGIRRGGLELPAVPLWPLASLLGLGVLQILPLPAPILRGIAPGPAAAWYPKADAAARLLGEGPRPISLDPGATAQALLLALGLASLALVASPALARPAPGLRAAAVVATAVAALAVYGIVARGRFGPLLYGRFAVPTVNPFGPFVSKNHFAGYVGPAALLTLGLCRGLAGRARAASWTGERTAPGVVLALVCALAMALSLLVSQSRGGVVAAACGASAFALLVYTRRPRARGVLPAALLGLALLGLLALALPDAARARVTTLEGASFRLETWKDGLRLFTRSPLVGHGFAAFADPYAAVKRGHGAIRVEHAENEYVEVLAEGGSVALGLVLLAFALPMRRVLERLARAEPLRRGLAAGALAALVALAAHSVFDFVLRIPAIATLAALLAAFLAAGAGPRPGRVPRAALAGAALALLGLGLWVAARGSRAFDPDAVWREVRSEVQAAASSASPEVRALRAERATARLERLLAGRPAFAEGWLLLAALCHERGDAAQARVLADHAGVLDPTRADLQAGVRSLRAP